MNVSSRPRLRGTCRTFLYHPGRSDRLNYHREGCIVKIEIDREEDGRWIGEIPDLPGVLAYGASREEAVAKAEALRIRVIADRLDHGESIPELDDLFAVPT